MSTSNFTDKALSTFSEAKNEYPYYATGAAVLLVSLVQYYNLRKRDVAVPSIGPSGRITSYYGAIKFLMNARAMMEEAYTKFQGRTFKAPQIGSWLIVVSKPELVEELRKAPENILSFEAATEESLQIKHTLGPYVYADQFHVGIIRDKLTQNLYAKFDDIKDEITEAFNDNVVFEEPGWKAFTVLPTIMQIVSRTSNRLFVGLPLCRNKEYVDLNIRFTVDVVQGGQIIRLFPNFLREIAGKVFTSIHSSTRLGLKLLGPLIESRLEEYKLYGKDWPDKPNDMLTWLIEEAPTEEQRSIIALTQRILTINFAAIHTSSMSFTHALFHLAARPEYIQPLREEIESVVDSEGWTKISMHKMRKLDSFIRESQRYTGIGMLSMGRKARVDYTLSDGTFLPKGTFVSANSLAVHFDPANYSNPYEFDGFRYSNIRAEVEGESAKNQLVATSDTYIPFGHGRHACPGRFFASNELKCMMAYLLLTYDVKLEDGRNGRPKDTEIETAIVPNATAKIMLRKR